MEATDVRPTLRQRLLDAVPLLVAAAVLLLVTAWLGSAARARTGGEDVYALDDTYIPLAVAKNLATKGVGGVTSQAATFACSSIAWPCLLALVFVGTGPREAAAHWLALASALLCLYAADRWLRRRDVGPAWRTAALLAVVAFAPLGTLVQIALEHPLHAAAAIAFAGAAEAVVSAADPGDRAARRSARRLCWLGAAAVAVRYESVFAVLIVAMLLVLRRRWSLALRMLGAAAVPVALAGAWGVSIGWNWLPNSVLLKAPVPIDGGTDWLRFALGIGDVGAIGIRALWRDPYLLVLAVGGFAALLVQLRRAGAPWHPAVVRWLIWLPTMLLHLQFARTGWLYRYEAWLVAWGLVVATPAAVELTRAVRAAATAGYELLQAVALVGLLLALWPLAERSWLAHRETPMAAGNIHDQQGMVAQLLGERFPVTRVAVHDIGLLCWRGDPDLLDLAGLAERQTAHAWREHDRYTAEVASFARNKDTGIAVAFANWFEPFQGVPIDWKRVGSWTLTHNVICGDATVVFYAVKPDLVAPLREALRAFVPRLPSTVTPTFAD